MAQQELQTAETKEVQTTGADSLIAQAIDKGLPVETLEKLLTLRDREEAREARFAFNRAMAAFQGECPNIEKTKVVTNSNGNRLYSYAPLDSIVSQVKDLLQKHGFSYSTKTEITDRGVKATCIVRHFQGHEEISEMEVPQSEGTNAMSASQKTAAATTFAKRYAFCNAFGIMTGDEDSEKALRTSEVVADAMVAYGEKLRAAKTVEELTKAYMNLPAMAKKELKDLAASLKVELMKD